MKSRQNQLISSLGPETASSFGGGSAGASVGVIQTLPTAQKFIARKAFADSLSTMWIMYVAFGAVGIAVSLLITRNKLDKQHEETKTGMEAEKQKKLERDGERAERRRKRASKSALGLDQEAQNDGAVGVGKETKA